MIERRIFSSLILSALVILASLVDWICGLVISLFIIFALYEFFRMLEKKGIGVYKYFGLFMGGLIPLSLIFRFELTKIWELFFILLGILFLILMQFRRRQNSGAILGISTTLFGILYISWFLSFFIRIRYLGWNLFFSLLLIVKLGDIGAYLIGSRFGKHPLLPQISPKKTIEGSLGGLLFSLLGALACGALLKWKIAQLVITGLFLGILGQLGDLSESLLKRDCGVKDSGNLIPGMGGILDVVDSLLFSVPAFYFYLNVVKP